MTDQQPMPDMAVPVAEIPCRAVDDDRSGECGQPSTHAMAVRLPRQPEIFHLLVCGDHARRVNYAKREFLDVTGLPPEDETT